MKGERLADEAVGRGRCGERREGEGRQGGAKGKGRCCSVRKGGRREGRREWGEARRQRGGGAGSKTRTPRPRLGCQPALELLSERFAEVGSNGAGHLGRCIQNRERHRSREKGRSGVAQEGPGEVGMEERRHARKVKLVTSPRRWVRATVAWSLAAAASDRAACSSSRPGKKIISGGTGYRQGVRSETGYPLGTLKRRGRAAKSNQRQEGIDGGVKGGGGRG